MRILYLTHEPWPTFRNDLAVLFGSALPQRGVTTDLVTERGDGDVAWGGGKAILHPAPRRKALLHLSKVWHNVRVLVAARRADYDAIQVRDMAVTAAIALAVARIRGWPFIFWMSFPKSDAHLARAHARGPRAGLRFLVPLAQGHIGNWLLLRIVLPRADHVFVQSERMLEDLSGRGVPLRRMTAVPMGVDVASADPALIAPVVDPRLVGRRVLVYLGTLDRERGIELLLQTLAIARRALPELVLVVAGDTKDERHRRWLHRTAEQLGVSESVIWTGWLPTAQGWAWVRAADIGLSPFPRGLLLDSASPTKAIEYMALGIPVVCNDNPDQARVVRESGAGLCIELTPEAFAAALGMLLADPARCAAMGAAGRRYVQRVRSYERLADFVADAYRQILSVRDVRRTVFAKR